jgi:transposase
VGLHNAIGERERQLIVRLTQDGKTAKDIARIIGRCVSAVTKVQHSTRGLELRNQFKPTHELTVRKIPEATMKLLRAAAERRHIQLEELAQLILVGTVLHGSIDRASNGFDRRFPNFDDAPEAALTGSEV